ncbi:hypothetical protein GCM10029963_51220 [Micromonospora andamanensis]|nr:hypothetical protein Vwe01_08780 [Micromonospora andamanensis]
MAGTLIGVRWQAREARRMRREQYDREDRLRNLDERRALYARFAQATDEVEDAQHDLASAFAKMSVTETPEEQQSAELRKTQMIVQHANKITPLYQLLWELELIAPTAVVDAARSVDDAIGNATGFDLPDEIYKAKLAFIAQARADLGLPGL